MEKTRKLMIDNRRECPKPRMPNCGGEHEDTAGHPGAAVKIFNTIRNLRRLACELRR